MLPRTLILWTIILTIPSLLAAQALPIGHWRDHLPWQQAIKVQASGNRLWCATPWSVFSVDVEENSLERWSKMNGRQQTGPIPVISRTMGRNTPAFGPPA